jgi:hypothetical protein
MDVKEVWAPQVFHKEIKSEGTLLDKDIPVKIDDKKIKIVYDLYYLKSKDVFVALINDTAVGSIQVVADQERVAEFKKKYLNQEVVESKDNFSNFEQPMLHSAYESEFVVSKVEEIKKTGSLLEVLKNGDEIYYFKENDTFVYVPFDEESWIPPYKYDSLELRKKYKIPYQDERFQDLY